jgi:hypothetical protein
LRNRSAKLNLANIRLIRGHVNEVWSTVVLIPSPYNIHNSMLWRMLLFQQINTYEHFFVNTMHYHSGTTCHIY